MEELIDLGGPIAQWIRDWGYLAVFLGIMLENAGIPIPGETMIVIASVFAGQKVLRVELVYLVVVAGAIIGDNLGYLIGLKGGRPLLLRMARWGRVSERQFSRTEARFRHHSDWAVFLGRFIPLLRIFAGPLAGMVRMAWPRFFLFNTLGAVIWCGVVVGLAFKVGQHAVYLLHNFGLFMAGVTVCTIAYVAYSVWQGRKENEAEADTAHSALPSPDIEATPSPPEPATPSQT